MSVRLARGRPSLGDHRWALRTSARIATNLRKMYWPDAVDIRPDQVVKVLNEAGINFTLLGANGIAGWLDEPRATQDVDVLIHSAHKKAVRAIQVAFPDLIMRDLSPVTRFMDAGRQLPVIDLIKSQAAIHKAVLKHRVQVGKTYSVPDLEMALVLKFAAMQSPVRALKRKLLDKADFFGIVNRNHEIIDRKLLKKLAGLVDRNGGEMIEQLLEEALPKDEPTDED